MENKSSKLNMENVFEQLAKIKKVEPETDLYFSINKRIQSRNVISIKWLSAAAAILIILFSVEIMVFKAENKNSSKSELTSLIPQTNNILYNE